MQKKTETINILKKKTKQQKTIYCIYYLPTSEYLWFFQIEIIIKYLAFKLLVMLCFHFISENPERKKKLKNMDVDFIINI